MNINTKYEYGDYISVAFNGSIKECIINGISITIDEPNGINILYSIVDTRCRNNRRFINEKDLNNI